MTQPATKTCVDCGAVKPLESFARTNKHDSRQPFCLVCHGLRSAKYTADRRRLEAYVDAMELSFGDTPDPNVLLLDNDFEEYNEDY